MASGIPVTFFTTGGHPDYHQATDKAEYIDYPKLQSAAELIRDVAVAVADLDHAVRVDGRRPVPNAPCKQ